MTVSLRIVYRRSMLQQKTSFASELLRKRHREGKEEETEDKEERKNKDKNKTKK